VTERKVDVLNAGVDEMREPQLAWMVHVVRKSNAAKIHKLVEQPIVVDQQAPKVSHDRSDVPTVPSSLQLSLFLSHDTLPSNAKHQRARATASRVTDEAPLRALRCMR